MLIIVRCCRYIKDLGSIDNEDEDIDIQEGSTKIKPKIIKILSTRDNQGKKKKNFLGILGTNQTKNYLCIFYIRNLA